MSLSESLQATFAAENKVGISRISPKMELHKNGYSTVLVRHYPANPDRFYAVIGSVKSKGVTGIYDVPSELVEFNGNTATTSYPASQIIKPLVLAQPVLHAETLEPVNANIVFNIESGQFESDVPIIGFGEVSYKTSYLILEYTAGDFVDRENVRGKIISVLNGKTATFNVPSYDLDDGRDEVEVARVVSRYLLAESEGERGAYEMPNDWGGEEPYYPANNHPVPDEEGSYEAERVHELLVLTPEGQFYRRRNNPAIHKPYVGVHSYNPEYNLKKGNSREKWAKQYINSFNWDSYHSVLKDRYKGIKLD